MRSGLLEENETPERTGGRPATRLRLANQTAQVLGAVLDAGRCQVLAAGLDGAPFPGAECSFPTPETYKALLDALCAAAGRLMDRPGVATLGVGVSMPGLIDYRLQRGVLSPNVPQTDGHAPGRDLGKRLGVGCVLLQESHALCLAERHYGAATAGWPARSGTSASPRAVGRAAAATPGAWRPWPATPPWPGASPGGWAGR